MSRLSKLKEISVVSRFDIAQYKNKTNELIDIRNKLKADYVLHGSMQKLVDDLKIYVELINLEDKSIKWSKSFERKITDLFEIQNEIATEIVNNLDINLTSEGQQMVVKASNPNIEAYSKYNAIKYNLIPNDSASIKLNLIELENIIKKETTYADAYALKSNLLMILYMHRTGFEMNAFTENIFEYPLIGFENSTLYKQVLINTEMALKYDRYNILANTIELYLTFHDWILDPYSPLNTRKALVKINDFRNKYPRHYLFDLISGQYEIAKDVIGLPNDKIKAIEHFKLAVEKTKNIYHDDFISRFGFGYYCNFLIRIFENNPNAFISDIIYYQSLMYDYKLS